MNTNSRSRPLSSWLENAAMSLSISTHPHQKQTKKHPGRLAYRVADVMNDPDEYIYQAGGISLRPYQREPLERIMQSIGNHLGDTLIIVFPRQSGKDEFLINLKVYLLHFYAPLPVGIVEVNPTYKPQTLAAVERFDRALANNLLTRHKWRKRGDFMRFIDKVWVSFLSGDKQANTVGASASLLLIINEAQDIMPDVYLKNFEPMTASTNATRLLAGTVWTSRTFLAQEIRLALALEKLDARKRLYMVDAHEVHKSIPWYGAHVQGAVSKYGRQHPLVKTQYFNEEIDAQGSMFTPTHRALMIGDRPAQDAPSPVGESWGGVYAFLLDVAGQEETSMSHTPFSKSEIWGGAALSLSKGAGGGVGRDAVTLRIVEIDLSTLETLQAPTYRAVHLKQWTGLNHLVIFGQLKALAEIWNPQHIVIDATGVGEGLWAMLDRAFPTRVIPVKFTQQQKSELGYGFLAIINTGRFRDCCAPLSLGGGVGGGVINQQYAACQSEILPGPRKIMRWAVPEGTRDENGQLIHDDIPVTDSPTAVLDRLDWSLSTEPLIVSARDPLHDMDKSF
jgi:hypothetical protein